MAPKGKELPKYLQQKASLLGGADTDYFEYISPDELPYCDKGGHKERSAANSRQHQEHWKKNNFNSTTSS